MKALFYIRCDMNPIIATGHVMRCLSIADAMKIHGEDTTFILADNYAVQMISDRGYECIVLGTSWDDMESELGILENIIKTRQIKRILVDSYKVTYNYLAFLHSITCTAYIDDLDMFTYPVDILICYANYYRKFNYRERYQNVRLLLGMKYAPLRRQFQKRSPKKINDIVENILIMSGGADEYNVTGRLLGGLDLSAYKTVYAICGRLNEGYSALKEKYGRYGNVVIVRSADNIEEYMDAADVAVSAGGTTLYELCAMGTPTISYAIADNQIDNVRQFSEDDIIDYVGDARYDDICAALKNALIKYGGAEERRRRSAKMQEFTDGCGAEYIAKAFL